MKKIISIALTVFGLAMAVSCQKEVLTVEEPSNLVPLTLTAGSPKTALVDGASVVFNAGDEISVWDGTAVQKFVTAEGGASAVFTGSVTEGATDLYAAFPYDAEMTVTDGVVRTCVPRVQYADQAGSFGANANVAVGKTTVADATLEMVNATSLIKVTIASSQVDSVLITGLSNETVSGLFKFTPGDDEPTLENVSAPTSSGAKYIINEVVLRSPDENPIAPGTYYVSVKPVSLSGVRYLFYGNSGKGALRYSTTPVELKRAKTRNFGTIDNNLNWQLFKSFNLRFRKSGHYYDNASSQSYWPFDVDKNPKGSSSAAVTATTFTINNTNYVITADGSTKYYLNSANGWYIYTHAGIYMEMPIIPGYKLISLGYSAGSSNQGTPQFASSDNSSFYGGAKRSPGSFKLTRWNFSGTNALKGYRLNPNKESGAWCVYQILLTYLGHTPASISGVTTEPADNFGETSATLRGTVAGTIEDPSKDITCGFYYRVKDSGNEFTKVTAEPALEFSCDLSGLSSGATYEYKAYASAGAGEVEGELAEFSTLSASSLTIALETQDFIDAGLPVYSKYPMTDYTVEDVPITATYTITKDGKDYTFYFSLNSASSTAAEYSNKYYVSFAYLTNNKKQCIFNGKANTRIRLPYGEEVGGRNLKSVTFESQTADHVYRLQYYGYDPTKEADGYLSVDKIESGVKVGDVITLNVSNDFMGKAPYYFNAGSTKSKFILKELVYD